MNRLTTEALIVQPTKQIPQSTTHDDAKNQQTRDINAAVDVKLVLATHVTFCLIIARLSRHLREQAALERLALLIATTTIA
jgi:hypothetical protein